MWRVLRPRRWSRYQFATNLVLLSFVWRHMAPSVSSFGCALLSAECASPAQLENGGSIVNISSILGLRTGGRVSAYAASKACGRHRALLCGQPTEPAAYWPAWQDKSVPSHGSGLTAASSAAGLAHRCHIDVARVQAALIHLTQTLALEWARHKIRVAHLT